MDICKKLGIKIRYYRKIRNLTQENLSERTGLDRTYISYIESGKKNLSLKSIEKIAVALNVTEKELFDFDNIKEEN